MLMVRKSSMIFDRWSIICALWSTLVLIRLRAIEKLSAIVETIPPSASDIPGPFLCVKQPMGRRQSQM